jgi:hypothetical protein
MGSRGACYDNAVGESFFATLKKELVHRRSWPTKHELRSKVFDYKKVFYNRERRHSTLGQRSPAEYEPSSLPTADVGCAPMRTRSMASQDSPATAIRQIACADDTDLFATAEIRIAR